MKNTVNWGRVALIAIPFLWLLFLFLLPFGSVIKMSLSDMATARPPYTPVFKSEEGIIGLWALISEFDFENYFLLSEDSLYWRSYFSSLKIATLSTIFTLLIGFPIAYGMAKTPSQWRATLVMLIILPFWTSFLIRVYAWIGILKQEGLLNNALIYFGIIDQPLVILNTDIAVYIGIVYSYLPFMVLPLYATLEKIDYTLLEAALDLGCSQFKTFWVIVVPLALPGIVAGCFLVFIPAMGEFVIPDLLGGSSTLMIGKTLWGEFFNNRDWPVSSAVAVILLMLLIVPIVRFQKMQEKELKHQGQ